MPLLMIKRSIVGETSELKHSPSGSSGGSIKLEPKTRTSLSSSRCPRRPTSSESGSTSRASTRVLLVALAKTTTCGLGGLGGCSTGGWVVTTVTCPALLPKASLSASCSARILTSDVDSGAGIVTEDAAIEENGSVRI